MSGTVQTSEGAGGPAARQQHAPGRREQRAEPLGVVRRLGSSGWRGSTSRDTSLSMINDMLVGHPWIGRILGYGEIDLLTASEAGTKKREILDRL